MPAASSSSRKPIALSSRIAWGSRVMPTPSGLISGARSYTEQARPRRFKLSASESPQIPPPTIATFIQQNSSLDPRKVLGPRKVLEFEQASIGFHFPP